MLRTILGTLYSVAAQAPAHAWRGREAVEAPGSGDGDRRATARDASSHLLLNEGSYCLHRVRQRPVDTEVSAEMMWDYNDSWMHGSAFGGWFMFVGMIVLIAAAVALVVYLVRQTSQPAGAGFQGAQGYVQAQLAASAQESPHDILKRRYANGEIEREEYLQRLADL
jgi:uncharacterized membrane protein